MNIKTFGKSLSTGRSFAIERGHKRVIERAGGVTGSGKLGRWLDIIVDPGWILVVPP